MIKRLTLSEVVGRPVGPGAKRGVPRDRLRGEQRVASTIYVRPDQAVWAYEQSCVDGVTLSALYREALDLLRAKRERAAARAAAREGMAE